MLQSQCAIVLHQKTTMNKKMFMLDEQTRNLYLAERECDYWQRAPEFGSPEQAQERLEEISRSITYQRTIRLKVPNVEFDDFVRSDGVYVGQSIFLCRKRNDAVLMHEFAHHIAISLYGAHGHASIYATTYLRLLHTFVSETGALELLDQFNVYKVQHNIKFRP